MPTVRDTAHVRVSSAVDGTRSRRTRSRPSSLPVRSVTVDPRVWREARLLCGPDQHIVVLSATAVRVVNGARHS